MVPLLSLLTAYDSYIVTQVVPVVGGTTWILLLPELNLFIDSVKEAYYNGRA